MPRFVRSATARWDTHMDPTNPGWVVDVQLSDGTYETYVPPPRFYHAPPDVDPARIVAATLAWEQLDYETDAATTTDEPF